MHKVLLTSILLSVCSLTSFAQKALFLTAGQSNTDGRVTAEALPSYLKKASEYAYVSFHSPYSSERLGKFYAYYSTSGTEGQPSRWAYDAVTYYYIGQALKDKFYVAKTSFGGTSIDPSVGNSGTLIDGTSWLPQYGYGYHWSSDPTFLSSTSIAGTTFEKNGTTYSGQSLLLAWIANIDAAIDAITVAGETFDIKAIIWHQGESDKNVGDNYYSNLKSMVAYVRNHLAEKTGNAKYSTLPFFCGTVPHASSLYNSTVEKAFFTLEDEDKNFHVIDLRDLTMLSDNMHFDGPSCELFGKRLYNRMIDEQVLEGERLDDIAYAEVDYSDFGGDEYVGETRNWTFEGYTTDLITTTTNQNGLYLHSSNSNSRRFISGSTSGNVTFADGTSISVSRTLSPVTGAYGWTPANVPTTANASQNFRVAVGANTLYAGRFSVMLSAPTASSSSKTTVQLVFNGKIVAEETFDNSTTIEELSYDATQAGTYFLYSASRYTLYAVRYVPTEDKSQLRQVTLNADGYAAFGNIAGAPLSLPESLKAWTVSPSESDSQLLEMYQIAGINKGDAVLLQGTPSASYSLPFALSGIDYSFQNDMTAQLVSAAPGENSGDDFINYLLQGNQFSKADGSVTIPAGGAYLSISNGAAQCQFNTLKLEIPDETDYNPFQATIGTDGYAIFANLTEKSLSVPNGVQAFSLLPGDIDDDVVKSLPVTAIGVGQAVLLRATANETFTFTASGAESDVQSGNLLVAVDSWKKPLATDGGSGNRLYVFNGNEFILADGKIAVNKGEGYLLIPSTSPMANFITIRLFSTPVSYDFIDVYSLFGNDEVVWAETTWAVGDMTTPSSDGVVQQLNGLYGCGQSGSTNRSFRTSSAAGSATFSDGTAISWTKYLYVNADYAGSWSLQTNTTANNTTCGDYLALNAAVPGTLYILFSSNTTSSQTLTLYSKGKSATSSTSSSNTDIKEIKYHTDGASTLLLDCRKTCRVYAFRFVPDETAGVYLRVNNSQWAAVSLPYPAVVPEQAAVYYAISVKDGTSEGEITMRQKNTSDIIPAKAGFVMNAPKGLYRLAKSDENTEWTENLLSGAATEPATASGIYTLSAIDSENMGFKKQTASTTVNQYGAFLRPANSLTASVLRFVKESIDTSVRNIQASLTTPTSIYNLGGISQNTLQPGMNIVREADGKVRKIHIK